MSCFFKPATSNRICLSLCRSSGRVFEADLGETQTNVRKPCAFQIGTPIRHAFSTGVGCLSSLILEVVYYIEHPNSRYGSLIGMVLFVRRGTDL